MLDYLHLGKAPHIFQHININDLACVFNLDDEYVRKNSIYEQIFEESVKDLSSENLTMLTELLALLQEDNCSDNLFNISLVLLDNLNKVSVLLLILFGLR